VIHGQDLQSVLKISHLKQTLLVIPAGPSSEIEEVFSKHDLEYIKESVRCGLFLYTTCGSTYAAAALRFWGDDPTPKKSTFGIFDGIARGPLFPDPTQPHGTDFIFESVNLCYPGGSVNLLLGGGGSLFYEETKAQKTLAEYNIEDLSRAGKDPSWVSAVVMTQIEKGRAIFSMVHPATGKSEISLLRGRFPGRKDDWERIALELSSEAERYCFMHYLIDQFEN
jgi:glutamine amidotransferase-like uncharacterized protein